MKHGSVIFLTILLIIFMTALVVQHGFSHPHVFITAEVTPRFEDNRLRALDVEWIFDEFYSATLLFDADKDKNLIIDDAESKFLHDDAFVAMKPIHYFLRILDENNKEIVPGEVKNFRAHYNKKLRNLVYSFTFDLNIEADALYKSSLFFVDDGYYIDYRTELSTNYKNVPSFSVKADEFTIENEIWGSFNVSGITFIRN